MVYGSRPSSRLRDQDWDAITARLGLSKRQREIVHCVFDGFDERAIGLQLDISAATVHTHLNRLYRKLEINCRCELIVRVFLAYMSVERANAAANPTPCTADRQVR